MVPSSGARGIRRRSIHRSAWKGDSPKFTLGIEPETDLILNCPGNYPSASTICRWTGFGTTPMMWRTAITERAPSRKRATERRHHIMPAEENKDIMRRYFGVFEQGNIDLLDELLASDYLNHTPATPEVPTGPEGVKGVVSMFRGGIPDLRVVVEDMIAEGDKVVTRYTMEGTHGG